MRLHMPMKKLAVKNVCTALVCQMCWICFFTLHFREEKNKTERNEKAL